MQNIIFCRHRSFLYQFCTTLSSYVSSSGKTQLMDEQKEQALIRRRAFCTVSDQSLDCLSHLSICRKHISDFRNNLKTIYVYKYMEKADLGKHCLLLNKLGFPQWCHKFANHCDIAVSAKNRFCIKQNELNAMAYQFIYWLYFLLIFLAFIMGSLNSQTSN